MIRSLGELLQGWLKNQRLEGQLHVSRLPKYWESVVGIKVAGRTAISSFENGVLRIHVSEAAWRSELTLRREELRKQINVLAGGEMVREIIFR